MIINFCVKHPDCVSDAIDDEESCGTFYGTSINPEKLKKEINKWFKYEEYLYLEYNIETKKLTIRKP